MSKTIMVRIFCPVKIKRVTFWDFTKHFTNGQQALRQLSNALRTFSEKYKIMK